MNLSRIFILRPVATTLLMAAILLAGALRTTVARIGAAPGGLPHYPGSHILSRRKPRSYGFVRDSPSRTPVRHDARPEADDIFEFQRRLSYHASVYPGAKSRRGRATGPGSDKRGFHVLAARPSDPARLQQSEPCRRADPHSCFDF